jgi:site-specific recombinase XerD
VNLTVLEAERILRDHPDRIQRLSREAVIKDKTYQLYPMGMEAAEYLRYKRKRLTASSMRDYESCLDKLARYFTDLELKDFEPPLGTERLEEFLDETWGSQSPRTYNKNLSIIGDFFEKAVLRRKLHGDPTLPIERAKARQVHREIFNGDQRRAIMAANQADRRNRVALRLLLDYGLRKGSLQAVRFEHFDHERKRLTIFAKGGKVRNLPVPDPAFWHDLERLILESEARPFHYLMPRRWAN